MSTSSIDARLVGMWYLTESISCGDISFNKQVCRILGPNRRFVDLSQNHDTSIYETYGDWNGWDTFCARLSLQNRGFWNSDDSTLHLYWDDNRYMNYNYEYDRAALILKPHTSQPQLWARRKAGSGQLMTAFGRQRSDDGRRKGQQGRNR